MVGRPRIYDSVEQLEQVVIDYFYPKYFEDKPVNKEYGPLYSESFLGISDKDNVYRHKIQKPSITGLTLHLGFADKTTLYDYRDRPEYSHPIKWALTMIEKYHEEGLSENNVTGRIFALKNMGWKDKTETELSGGVKISKPSWFDDGIQTKAT